MALVVESLAITAVGGFVVWLFCWEDVFGFSLESLLLEEAVGLLPETTSVEKAAVGRLICLAGSWRVVWWNPLQTWHRFCDGHVCLWCLLLKQFVHKFLWLTRLYRSPGEHNWYSGQVAMLCSCLHFSQDRFVLKVLFGTFCEVDGCFCWGAKFQCFLLFSADALLTDNGRLLLYGLVCRLFELTNFEAWELMVLWLLSRLTLS